MEGQRNGKGDSVTKKGDEEEKGGRRWKRRK
jgi:hypothetical protein